MSEQSNTDRDSDFVIIEVKPPTPLTAEEKEILKELVDVAAGIDWDNLHTKLSSFEL